MDALRLFTRRDIVMPWETLKQWNPFRIDALGLVTLLGADEVNKSVGTLQRRRFTEYLPLLAAFIIAGDRFTDEQSGYALYNITDGIYTTELKGWFTRWLSSQKINSGTTTFRWRLGSQSISPQPSKSLALLISLLAIAPLLVITILMGDWFGLGNTFAIIASILVRAILLSELRQAFADVAVPRIKPQLPLHEKKPSEIETEAADLHRESSQPSSNDVVKLFVTRADGRMVTIYTPRSILSTFTRDLPVQNPNIYHFVRWIGWAAFGAHVCVLGMCTLITQIYTVVLLVLSTWWTVHNFEADSLKSRGSRSEPDGSETTLIAIPFGAEVQVEQENPSPCFAGEQKDRRLYAFVRAEPTERQEMMLRHWSMLPFEGVRWYDGYEQAKKEHTKLSEKDVGNKSPPRLR
ncbi:MAG: hypothetical protein Q9157_003070 [Trypethelium eluteriae]